MQITELHWQPIAELLSQKLGQVAFDSWIKPLKVANDQEAGSLNLEAPTKFMKDWVVRNYSQEILNSVTEVIGQSLTLNISVNAEAAAPITPSSVSNPAKPATPKKEAAPKAVEEKKKQVSAPTTVSKPEKKQVFTTRNGMVLEPKFTFDNFVTGKSNNFAYSAAKAIAESEELIYNPFVLYGGVGLGKTHLMHAIAQHIAETHPDRKVVYMSSEKFMHKFVSSLQNKSTMSFKEEFRSVDLLMIDDVQFIAGKGATQEEFFHTFNALVDMRKQIILTADRSPHEMDNLEDRLRSRLGSGLTCEIHMPDLETRLAILDTKAKSLDIDLGKDVAMFLADKIASNVRELEGALNRLIAHSKLTQREITLESAQDLLKDLFRVYNQTITIDEIQRKVAEYFKIKVADMHSARRSRDIARPRQIAMWFSKQLTSKSFPDIGKSFGGKDHTTVMHAVKSIDKLVDADPSVKEDIGILKGLLTR